MVSGMVKEIQVSCPTYKASRLDMMTAGEPSCGSDNGKQSDPNPMDTGSSRVRVFCQRIL